MGWGIEFKTEIFLSRQSYSSKSEVEDKIDEIDQTISDFKSEIKMYAASTPKDIVSFENSEDTVNWLNIRINDLFELIEDHLFQRYQLSLYLEYLNDGGEIIKSE